MSIPIYTKQSGDTIDVDIDFSDWLPATDNIASYNATSDDGLTLGATISDLVAKKIKQWVSGGTSPNRYKVTVQMTSLEGRVKEVDFYIKVKDI